MCRQAGEQQQPGVHRSRGPRPGDGHRARDAPRPRDSSRTGAGPGAHVGNGSCRGLRYAEDRQQPGGRAAQHPRRQQRQRVQIRGAAAQPPVQTARAVRGPRPDDGDRLAGAHLGALLDQRPDGFVRGAQRRVTRTGEVDRHHTPARDGPGEGHRPRRRGPHRGAGRRGQVHTAVPRPVRRAGRLPPTHHHRPRRPDGPAPHGAVGSRAAARRCRSRGGGRGTRPAGRPCSRPHLCGQGGEQQHDEHHPACHGPSHGHDHGPSHSRGPHPRRRRPRSHAHAKRTVHGRNRPAAGAPLADHGPVLWTTDPLWTAPSPGTSAVPYTSSGDPGHRVDFARPATTLSTVWWPRSSVPCGTARRGVRT